MDWGSTLPQKSPVPKGFGAKASFTGLQSYRRDNKETRNAQLGG